MCTEANSPFSVTSGWTILLTVTSGPSATLVAWQEVQVYVVRGVRKQKVVREVQEVEVEVRESEES